MEADPTTGGDGGTPQTRTVSEEIRKRRETLPIFSMKTDLIEAMRKHQVLIVVGDTGSGKSTQLPQYLYEAGFGTCGRIACTQPRRVAALTLGTRVAEEMGCQLGDTVGYRIRFDNKTARNTSVIFMSDGTLLRELAMEPLISSYSAIMLDEAHERNLNTDLLLGIMKLVIRKRPELKLLITSATLEDRKFSQYFNNAPVIKIPGQTFPVEIIHVSNPVLRHENACANTVMDIHRNEAEGDILVFLEGQDEIEKCCELISATDSLNELWLVRFYASLPMEEQNTVFSPCRPGYKRKVVVATNVAETSITIDGVVYVVDSGKKKQIEFDPRRRIKLLNRVQITRPEAVQRAGRAGRTRPGKCYRLYGEYTFDTMLAAPMPEIQRSNLESNMLLLAAYGVENIYAFDFIDHPPRAAIAAAVSELEELEVVDSSGRLTQLGRQIIRFPLDPKQAKTLATSTQLECSEDVVNIVSILSAQSTAGKVFKRNSNGRLNNASRDSFSKAEGDHLTLLNVYREWERNGGSREWCQQMRLNEDALEEAARLREQLLVILESNQVALPTVIIGDIPQSQAVQRCILSGYFSQIACRYKRSRHGYITYANENRNEEVFIHPSSVLFRTSPEWVIYEELMNTGRQHYMINVVAVEPHWVQDHAPRFYEKLVRKFPPLFHNY